MKKIILFMLTLLMIFSCTSFLLSCGGGIDSTDNSNITSQNCTHSYTITENEATCTSGGYTTYKCSLCSSSYREYSNALGHTTTSGICSRCNQTFGIWEKAFYVDEFNSPTNEAYIRNSDVFVGTFSNSATTNSKLYARILIDSDDIAIKLWEYGSNEVNAYSTTSYNITVQDDKGNKHKLYGTMYKNGERIYLSDSTFTALLQQNKKLKVYIEEASEYRYHSTYLFELENGNFNAVYADFIK